MRMRLLACLLLAGASLGAASPTLSDVEQLQVRVLQLETALAQAKADAANCIGQLGRAAALIDSAQLTEKEAALKRTIEAAHPGFTWDPKTGTFAEVK